VGDVGDLELEVRSGIHPSSFAHALPGAPGDEVPVDEGEWPTV
jgi:hypothetical protein